jgi:DNA-binding response OmpR family regulator
MYRILVAEDEREIGSFLGARLKQAGWDTIIASSLDDALRCLKNSRPDLILTDHDLGNGGSSDDIVKYISESLSGKSPSSINPFQNQNKEKGVDCGDLSMCSDCPLKDGASAEVAGKAPQAQNAKPPSIILFSQYLSDLRRREDYWRRGIDLYLPKPVSSNKIIGSMLTILIVQRLIGGSLSSAVGRGNLNEIDLVQEIADRSFTLKEILKVEDYYRNIFNEQTDPSLFHDARLFVIDRLSSELESLSQDLESLFGPVPTRLDRKSLGTDFN